MDKNWFRFIAVALILLVIFAVKAKDDTTEPEMPSELKWPKVIDTQEARITIYQPQLETFEDNRLTSRFAASVQSPEMEEPVFGAVWIKAKMEILRDDRLAKLVSIESVQSRFRNAKPEDEKWFANILKKEIPTWDIILSIDQIISGLEIEQQRLKTEHDLNNDPPKIIYVDYPATLVMVDGTPILKPIENTELMAVINTPFPMVFRKKDKTYYLIGKEAWYRAKEVDGKWQKITQPPEDIASLQSTQAPEGEEAPIIDSDVAVFGATEPAEMLSTDGKPKFIPFPGNALMYVENTRNDLLYEVDSGRYYLLLSGRWYGTEKLEGPWTYVPPDKVPKSFADIPSESEKSDLRASVPGTPEAKEAVLDAQIPETAAIQRSEAKLSVEYDGDPEFKEIEETGIAYAVNTATPVIRIKGKYYAVDNGVWFVSSKAIGPWAVADTVPSEVQDIPPSCPVNNIKYVYIYDSTPEVVYVGYTPGYTGCYVYHGVIVYGTGYYYHPWYRHYYYPRAVTYGFSIRYSSYYGWSFGYSFYSGPFSFHFGHVWGHPHYGGWWGPPYYRPPYYRPPYYRPLPPRPPPPGHKPPVATPPIAKPPGKPPVARPPGSERPVTLPGEGNLYDRRPDRAVRPETGDANLARPAIGDMKENRPVERPSNLPNNVYTDKEGNIYRRGENGWERRQNNKWERPAESRPAAPSQIPSRPSGSIQQPSQPVQRPSGQGQQPVQRPSVGSGSSRPSTYQQLPSTSQSWGNQRQSLERQHDYRSRGNQRTQQFHRSRPSSPSSGSFHRGGGRGRMR